LEEPVIGSRKIAGLGLLGLGLTLAVVAAARRSREARQKPGESSLGETPATTSEQLVLEWTESQSVYRPEPVRNWQLAASLGLSAWALKSSEAVHVLVREEVMDLVESHLASDTSIELGGVLFGRVLFDEERDSHFVLVEHAAPATGGRGTAANFEFTPEAWLAIEEVRRELPDDMVLVGWYHSHPGFGVFLSGTDMRAQSSFFIEPWQLALVVDPVRRQEGWFCGGLGERIHSSRVHRIGNDRILAVRHA
jgi:proteasome lid subunit RPN8/RPN11